MYLMSIKKFNSFKLALEYDDGLLTIFIYFLINIAYYT
jgi:hypothetical protein